MTEAARIGRQTRVDRLLRTEPIVWVSTVRPDGLPHVVPIWFWWDGASVLIASKPQARKVANLMERPECMLAVGDADADFDVALIEARAELAELSTQALLEAGLFAKYGERMAAIGLDAIEFASTYSLVLRFTPTRCLPWHGRAPREEPTASLVA